MKKNLKRCMTVMSALGIAACMSINVNAESSLGVKQTVEVETENGSYTISIDNIHKLNEYKTDDNMDVLAIQCSVENIDYNDVWDKNTMNTYDVSENMTVVDSEGYSAEFYNLDSNPDGAYAIGKDIDAGSKARASMLYFVTPECSNFTIKIDNEYVMDVALDEKGEMIKSEQMDKSNDEKNSNAQMSELEKLKKENEELAYQLENQKSINKDLAEQIKVLKKKVYSLESELESKSTTTLEENETPKKSEEAEQPVQPQEPVTEYKDATTIRIVQQSLNEAGFNCGTPDGIAGGNTSKAITSYQTEKGITVNGLITDELLQSLNIVEKVQEAIKAEGAKNEYSADYTYDQLARNPDTYKGKKVKMSGKVLQAETSDDICYARVALNSNYDTIIFVTYDKDLLGYRLLEDDMITVYGTSLGVYSYEAVSGATITIPWLNADIIEM